MPRGGARQRPDAAGQQPGNAPLPGSVPPCDAICTLRARDVRRPAPGHRGQDALISTRPARRLHAASTRPAFYWVHALHGRDRDRVHPLHGGRCGSPGSRRRDPGSGGHPGPPPRPDHCGAGSRAREYPSGSPAAASRGRAAARPGKRLRNALRRPSTRVTPREPPAHPGVTHLTPWRPYPPRFPGAASLYADPQPRCPGHGAFCQCERFGGVLPGARRPRRVLARR